MSVAVETTVPSVATSFTHASGEKADSVKSDRNSAGKVEETSSDLEDDWENDSVNPRNWPIRKKWLATSIVNAIASYHILLALMIILL